MQRGLRIAAPHGLPAPVRLNRHGSTDKLQSSDRPGLSSSFLRMHYEARRNLLRWAQHPRTPCRAVGHRFLVRRAKYVLNRSVSVHPIADDPNSLQSLIPAARSPGPDPPVARITWLPLGKGPSNRIQAVKLT